MRSRTGFFVVVVVALALFAGVYFYLESDVRREGKAESYFDEARSLAEKGELFDAERALNSAISLKPDDAKYHSKLGEVLAKEGDYGRAEKSYEKAAELDPGGEHLYDAGRMALHDNRAGDAVNHFEKATHSDPKDLRSLYQLGVHYALHHDFDKARDVYNQILELSPDEPEAVRMLGWLAVQTGDYTEAQKRYDEALTLRPQYPELLNDMGNLLVLEGRRDEAKKRFEEALAQRPDYEEARKNLKALATP